MKKAKLAPVKKMASSTKKPMNGKSSLAKAKVTERPNTKPIAKSALTKDSKETDPVAIEGKHHDIIQMILDDHKPLKRCIEILKNPELSLSSRRAAFSEFAPLLTIHTRAEEVVLYHFEKTEIDMRQDAFEGEVEHALAGQMIEEIKQTVDKDLWSAKAKVLAEIVEHHIKEEETEMFLEVKKEAEVSDLIRLGAEYQAKKDEVKVDILHPAVQKQAPTFSVRH